MDRFDILNKLADFEAKLKELGFKTYISTEYVEKKSSLNYDFIHANVSREEAHENKKAWAVYDCTILVRYDEFLNTFVIYRDLYDHWNQEWRHFRKVLSQFILTTLPFDYLIKNVVNDVYNWEMRLDNSSEYKRKVNFWSL